MDETNSEHRRDRHSLLHAPIHIKMPTFTKANAIVAASKELVWVLQNDAPSNIRQTEKETLTALANIFNKVDTTMPN